MGENLGKERNQFKSSYKCRVFLIFESDIETIRQVEKWLGVIGERDSQFTAFGATYIILLPCKVLSLKRYLLVSHNHKADL